MVARGSELVPAVRGPVPAAWSAAPLIGSRGADTGRELSRTFKCFDPPTRGSRDSSLSPAARRMTLRRMAEATKANVVCRRWGWMSPATRASRCCCAHGIMLKTTDHRPRPSHPTVVCRPSSVVFKEVSFMAEQLIDFKVFRYKQARPRPPMRPSRRFAMKTRRFLSLSRTFGTTRTDR